MSNSRVRIPTSILAVERCAAAACAVFWCLPLAMTLKWVGLSVAVFAVMGLALAAWFALGALARRRTRRWLMFVASREFRVCPLCHYDLRDIATGTCPECGAGFDIDSLRELWDRTRQEYEASIDACT